MTETTTPSPDYFTQTVKNWILSDDETLRRSVLIIRGYGAQGLRDNVSLRVALANLPPTPQDTIDVAMQGLARDIHEYVMNHVDWEYLARVLQEG